MADEEYKITDRENWLMEQLSKKTAETATKTMQQIWAQIQTDLAATLKKAQADTEKAVDDQINRFLTQVSQNQSLTMSLSGLIEAAFKYHKERKIVGDDFEEFMATEMKAFEQRIIAQMNAIDKAAENKTS